MWQKALWLWRRIQDAFALRNLWLLAVLLWGGGAGVITTALALIKGWSGPEMVPAILFAVTAGILVSAAIDLKRAASSQTIVTKAEAEARAEVRRRIGAEREQAEAIAQQTLAELRRLLVEGRAMETAVKNAPPSTPQHLRAGDPGLTAKEHERDRISGEVHNWIGRVRDRLENRELWLDRNTFINCSESLYPAAIDRYDCHIARLAEIIANFQARLDEGVVISPLPDVRRKGGPR